jgi:hypothetical protein
LIVTKPCFCLHAYIISKKGAKKLLDLYGKIPRNTEHATCVIDIFLKMLMNGKIEANDPLVYYCYNGLRHYDAVNIENIRATRETGICFQNKHLGTTLFGEEIQPR